MIQELRPIPISEWVIHGGTGRRKNEPDATKNEEPTHTEDDSRNKYESKKDRVVRLNKSDLLYALITDVEAYLSARKVIPGCATSVSLEYENARKNLIETVDFVVGYMEKHLLTDDAREKSMSEAKARCNEVRNRKRRRDVKT